MKVLGYLKVFGGVNLSIASVFFISGLVRSLVILYPNHSTYSHANLNLSRDIARFSLSKFFRTVCGFSLLVSGDPFVFINMSSR